MKKLIGYIFIFLLGFLAAAWIYHTFPPVDGGSGKPSALNLLSAAVPSPPIGPNDIVNAAAKVEPAVVNIDTIGEPIRDQGWFSDLFGEDSGRLEPVVPKGAGSGVMIDPAGYIVTNNHVVDNSAQITVRLRDSDKKYTAKVIGSDSRSDLAVIKIDGKNFPYAQLGDSSKLKVGEWAIAIGNPLGLGTTVTVGVISATNRKNLDVDSGKVLERAIQTDAAINHGNSGGALANIKGQVIGINTAIASATPGGGSIGIGFAIPANSVKVIAKELIEKGRVVRPWVGIQYRLITPELRNRFRLPVKEGAIVEDVIPGSPAARAGIQVADIVVAVGGRKVKELSDVSDEIRKRKVGDTLDLRIQRNGREHKTRVKLGEMPSSMR